MSILALLHVLARSGTVKIKHYLTEKEGNDRVNIRMRKKKRVVMEKILSNPRFRGKHVIIVVAGKVFTAKTGEKASKILAKVRLKYPKETPAVTYIPDADALVGVREFIFYPKLE